MQQFCFEMRSNETGKRREGICTANNRAEAYQALRRFWGGEFFISASPNQILPAHFFDSEINNFPGF